MPLVEKYSFGSIRVRGKTYYHDIIISADTVSEWRRAEGHVADAADLASIVAQGPAVLVIGTGYNGRMNVSKSAVKMCAQNRIELVVEPTAKATDLYNGMVLDRKPGLMAAFHITC